MSERDYIITSSLTQEYTLAQNIEYTSYHYNEDVDVDDVKFIQASKAKCAARDWTKYNILMFNPDGQVVAATEEGVQYVVNFCRLPLFKSADDSLQQYLCRVTLPHKFEFPIVMDKSSYLIISGGFVNEQLSQMQALIDTETEVVKLLPPLPLPLVGHSIVATPLEEVSLYYSVYPAPIKVNRMFLFGGFDSNNQINTNIYTKMGIFDEWTEYKETFPHEPRAFQTTCSTPYHAFIHGGIDGNNIVSNQLWYNDGGMWMPFGENGPFLYKHVSGFIGEQLGGLYICGGYDQGHQPNKALFVFDFFSLSWFNLGTLDIEDGTEILSIAYARMAWGKRFCVLTKTPHSWGITLKKLNNNPPTGNFQMRSLFEFDVSDVKLISQSQSVFSTMNEGEYEDSRMVFKTFQSGKSNYNEFLDDFYRELEAVELPRVGVFHISVATHYSRRPLALMFPYKQPLTKFIENHPLSIHEVVRYAYQLAVTVEGFHFHKLVHGDLKLDNCLMGPNDTVWLCDLGLVQNCLAKKQRFFSFHAAPELWENPPRGYDLRKTDVYALGFTFWQLLTNGKGKYPFDNFPVQYASQIGIRPALPPCPNELKELIESCWRGNSEKRPTIYQIIETLKQIATMLGVSTEIVRLGPEVRFGKIVHYKPSEFRKKYGIDLLLQKK